jgi:predicted nicotinamide N-methyase
MLFTTQEFTFGAGTLKLFVPINDREVQSAVSPYWAKVWPAAIALCQFLQSNLHYIKNKTVAELAAGLGLPSLFAAQYAIHVYCSDVEPAAVELIKKSAAQNSFKNITCFQKNLANFYGEKIPDTLLLSDINYDIQQFDILHKMIQYYLQNGCTIILSTPQRLMAKGFVEQLLKWCKCQEQIDTNGVYTSIFVLQQ